MKKIIFSLCLLWVITFAVACNPQGDGGSLPNLPTFYTVTFVQEGQANEVKTVEQGKNLPDLPKITATPPVGYSYEWERTDFSSLSGDVTVRLKAVPNTYTVHYDIGSDSYAQIQASTQSVVFDSAFTPLIPTRFGYTFVGWLIKGTNEPFESQTYKVAGDTYLVAKWETDVYSDRWFTPDF